MAEMEEENWRVRGRTTSMQEADEAERKKKLKNSEEQQEYRGGSQDARRTKESSQGSSSKGSGEDVMVSTIKCCLWTAQQVRMMQSGIWDFALAPPHFLPAVAAKEIGLEYDAQVKKKGKKHGLGPPHLHVAVGFLAELSKINLDNETLGLMACFLECMNREQIGDLIPHMRIKQAWAPREEERKWKITFMIRPLAENPIDNAELRKKVTDKEATRLPPTGETTIAAIRASIVAGLAAAGCETSQGAAPRTDMERKLETALKPK